MRRELNITLSVAHVVKDGAIDLHPVILNFKFGGPVVVMVVVSTVVPVVIDLCNLVYTIYT